MSATKLEYPEESFPTLQPAFVVKVWGITQKYAAADVTAGGGVVAVVCLAFPSAVRFSFVARCTCLPFLPAHGRCAAAPSSSSAADPR